VVSSPLWQRVKKSQSAMAEVPFSLRIEGAEVPHIISGTMDLVFKEPDGWVIVDYKTDKVNGNLQALKDFYRSQVEMYRRFWVEISGEPVKEAGLFFLSAIEWVVI
jgi:ATP-dependent helicase/nuclease subunit A